MRKKISALLLALLTAFSAFACGETPDNPNGPSGPSDPSNPGTEQTTPVFDAATTSPDYDEISEETLATYTTYYFDSENGRDSYKGVSESKPKKSLGEAEKIISEVTADKPTRILFKAGSVWTEDVTKNAALLITGYEATEETPLIVGTYGVTADDKYATIVGTVNTTVATIDGTLILIKGSNVRLSGFEVTAAKGRKGIVTKTDGAGATKNVVIANNWVHDINYDWEAYEEWLNAQTNAKYDSVKGKKPQDFTDEEAICYKPELVTPDSAFGYGYGGIFTSSGTDAMQGASWHENVWIEGNLIERVARSGMFLGSGWYSRPGRNWDNGKWCEVDGVEYGVYPNKYMVVRNNVVNYVGGDSIVLLDSYDSYIEGNVSYHSCFLSRAPYYNAGIWPHSCTNLVMQYNEASWAHFDNGSGDGQGFDIDIGNKNIIFQYNYSHHNRGGAILFCNAGSMYTLYDKYGNYVLDEDGLPQSKFIIPYWGDVIVRNNVFTDSEDVIDASNYLYDMEFYNNIVISSATRDGKKVMGMGTNWSFYNNIFATRDNVAAVFTTSFSKDIKFENNVFWNVKDARVNDSSWIANPKNNVEIDPGIVNVEALNGYENCKRFIPTNEAVFSVGRQLMRSNKYDLNGKDVEGVLYAGAFGKK